VIFRILLLTFIIEAIALMVSGLAGGHMQWWLIYSAPLWAIVIEIFISRNIQ